MMKIPAMNTLHMFCQTPPYVPPTTAWYLSDLGEARGKQELVYRRSPHQLKTLREHALIESAISSNRIEGVTIEPARIDAVILGKSHLRDRDEEEVRGYRQALKLIHDQHAQLEFGEGTIKRLHALSRGEIGDAGLYKTRDSDIIEKYPDGRVRVRFTTVSAAKTPEMMQGQIQQWPIALAERCLPPPILLAACNLDFLCIHPFRDGNGRVSRLLLLLQAYHLGYQVGRYVSLERLIEQNKERYYETLEQSSQGWHTAQHNPWPYINFLLFILKEAYREFEMRLGRMPDQRGAKTALILQAIQAMIGSFSVGELQAQCPGVSPDLIRRVLKQERQNKRVECLGRGRDARWRKSGPTSN